MNKMERFWQKVFPGLVLAAAAVINLVRLPYGFPSTDESFFITLIHRLYIGDLPVTEIWNPVQFAGMLGLPFFALFEGITGGTDGIFVYFRFLYVLMMAVPALLIYRKCRDRGPAAACAAAVYMLYSLLQLMFFHYDTIGLACMTMAGYLLCLSEGRIFVRALFAGIFYAMAVLCTPHLALLYFAGSAVLLVHVLFRSQRHAFAKRCWLPFTLGCVIMALIIFAVIFSRISFGDFLGGFGNLLASDARNTSAGSPILINTLALFKMLWLHNAVTAVAVPVYVMLIGYACLPKRKVSDEMIFGAGLILSAVLVIAYRRPPYDYAMIMFNALGFLCLVLKKDADVRLKNLYLCGLAYMFMINISSNTILSVSSHASALTMIPAVLLSADVLKGLPNRKLPGILFGVLMAVMLVSETADRMLITWEDGRPMDMHETIMQGPAKGIRTGEIRKVRYDEDYEEVRTMLGSSENVLFFADHSWMYLMLGDDSHYAVYSSWFELYKPEVQARLAQYYESVPARVPDLVLMPIRVDDQLANLETIVSPYGIVMEKNNRWYSGRR